jgi:hypothetical protein
MLERQRPAAGRHLRRRAVPVLLLRQHRADLPRGRADRCGLPIPGPALRPRLLARASASTAPPVVRCAPTTAAARCCADWQVTTRGQRGVELRQGSLGLPVRHDAGQTDRTTGPRRVRPARADLLGRRARRRGAGARRSARVDRSAGRWPRHDGGRVRLCQARPGSPAHQRHRLPRPAPLRRGGVLPRRACCRPGHGRDLRRPREGTHGAARRDRARGGVPDRLPPAAQGSPARNAGRARDRAVRQPWAREALRDRAADSARLGRPRCSTPCGGATIA